MVSGFVGGLLKGAGASATATFYRAVGGAEAADIARTGALRTAANSAEGKYLTNTAEAAAEWGRRLHGEGARVVEVTVPKAAANAVTPLGRIDGIGKAWFATMDQLKDAAVRFLR